MAPFFSLSCGAGVQIAGVSRAAAERKSSVKELRERTLQRNSVTARHFRPWFCLFCSGPQPSPPDAMFFRTNVRAFREQTVVREGSASDCGALLDVQGHHKDERGTPLLSQRQELFCSAPIFSVLDASQTCALFFTLRAPLTSHKSQAGAADPIASSM